MRPTPSLSARIRFSTKDVGKGFYRGNRTGSMGSHTPKGEYVIDYRKVRNYAVPKLEDFQLTPYVSKEITTKSTVEIPIDEMFNYNDIDKTWIAQDSTIMRRERAMKLLAQWKHENGREFENWEKHQRPSLEKMVESFRDGGEPIEAIERYKKAAAQEDQKNTSTEQF